MTRAAQNFNQQFLSAIAKNDIAEIDRILDDPSINFVKKRNPKSFPFDVEINEKILEIYSSEKIRREDKLRILQKIIEIDSLKSGYGAAAKVVDLNYKNKFKRSIISYVISFNDLEALKYLVAQGVDLENKQGNRNYSPLILAIEVGSDDCARCLVESGANLMVLGDSAENILMAALRTNQEDLALFIDRESKGKLAKLKDEVGDDALFYAQLRGNKRFVGSHLVGDKNEYEFAVYAKKIIDLMYSQQDSPGFVEININLIQKFIANIASRMVLPAVMYKYNRALNEIAAGIKAQEEGKKLADRVIQVDGGFIELILLPYIGHAAFAMIKYDQSFNALELSYCDGNLPLYPLDKAGYSYGELVFKINNKFRQTDVSTSLIEAFKEYKVFDEDGKMDLATLEEIIAAVTETKGNQLKPIGGNIMTQPQNRGNCSIKSVNILLRALLKKQNPRLQFDIERNGVFCGGGDGYEEYKEFKKFLINQALEYILTIAQTIPNRVESVYGVVLESLKKAILHSAAKDNPALMARISSALENFGFSKEKISQLKNQKGQNIFNIAARKMALKSLSWCAKNQIEVVKDDKNQNAYDAILKEKGAGYEILMKDDKIAALSESSMLNLAASAIKFGRSNMLARIMDEKNLSIILEKYRDKKVDQVLAIYAALIALSPDAQKPREIAESMHEAVIVPLIEQYKNRSKIVDKAQQSKFSVLITNMSFLALQYHVYDVVLELFDAGLGFDTQSAKGQRLISEIFNFHQDFMKEVLLKYPEKFSQDFLEDLSKICQQKMLRRQALIKDLPPEDIGKTVAAKEEFYKYREISRACEDIINGITPKGDAKIISKDVVLKGKGDTKYSIISEV